VEPVVEMLSRDEINRRRAELLASTGLDLETLRERAENWQLSPEQRFAWEEYDGLTWILGG